MEFFLKVNFDFSLFKLREHGLQSISRLRRSTKKPICNSHVTRFESVRIVDCFAVIVMIFYGIAAALFLLCIELILKKLDSLKTNSVCALLHYVYVIVVLYFKLNKYCNFLLSIKPELLNLCILNGITLFDVPSRKSRKHLLQSF